MPVDLNTVASMVNSILNAAQTYTPSPTDGRFYTAQLSDVILSIDGKIATLICMNPSHGRRKDFLTGIASNVGDTTQLPSRVGPIESVQFAIGAGGNYIRAGKTLRATELPIGKVHAIQNDNLNPNANDNILPRYALEGDTMYHNGPGIVLGGATSVTVNVTYCVYTRTAACQAPTEHTDSVLEGSLSLLATPEGENTALADFFGKQYQLQELGIAAGLPTVPRYQLMSQLASQQQGVGEQ